MYAKWTRFSDFSDSISDRGTNIILTAFSSESGSCNSSVTLTPNSKYFKTYHNPVDELDEWRKVVTERWPLTDILDQDKSNPESSKGPGHTMTHPELRPESIFESRVGMKVENETVNHPPCILVGLWVPVSDQSPHWDPVHWDAVCLREKREVAKPNWSRMCFRPHGELHTQGPCSVSCHVTWPHHCHPRHKETIAKVWRPSDEL